MAEAGMSTPRGYEAIVLVRMPAPFRDWAVAYLSARSGNQVVTEQAIVALFQDFIDRRCLHASDDPPSCDPGGGMRSPDDCDEEQTALV